MMTAENVGRDQLFDNVIASLRQAALDIEDFRLGIRLSAAIASVTHYTADVNLAIEKARGSKSKSLRSEALAIVAKTLAEAMLFDEARLVVSEMEGLDDYWIAEACIWIARFSGLTSDMETAKSAVFRINAVYLRNEAEADMKNLLHRRHHHTGVHSNKHHSDFKALQAILSELKGLESSQRGTAKFTSSYLRLKAEEIIARLFADAMQ